MVIYNKNAYSLLYSVCLKLMVTFWELIKETLHVLGKLSHDNAASSSKSALASFKIPALKKAAVETSSCLALLPGSPKRLSKEFTLATYPGSQWVGERESVVSTVCACAYAISQKSWEIGNYRVISVKP